MIILVFADYEEQIYSQKFLNEKDMNEFLNKNDVIIIGSKILN